MSQLIRALRGLAPGRPGDQCLRPLRQEGAGLALAALGSFPAAPGRPPRQLPGLRVLLIIQPALLAFFDVRGYTLFEGLQFFVKLVWRHR